MSRFTIRISRGQAPPEAREIRRRVFVEEQGVAAAEEWDEHDAARTETLHFVAFEAGRAVGCARLRDYADADAAKVERVAVLPEHRKLGLGRALMEAAETEARRRGQRRLVLHAQLAVIPFYERLGWRALGPEFVEAGIAHRKMEKTDASAGADDGWRRLGRERSEWVRPLVQELALLPGVEAVVLGGSFARGRAREESDVDLGLLYHDAHPIDVGAVRSLSNRWNDAPSPIVSELYEWGPWVNGGAWLTVRGERVDLLYRSLDRVERTIRDASDGRYEIHFAQQPPFGFWSGTLLGECAVALPLHDPAGHAARLRGLVAAFPDALRVAVVRDMLQAVAFGLEGFARKFAARGDVFETVSCLARFVWQLGLALFALNRSYLVNDKTLLDEIEGFALAPGDFRTRAETTLSNPGRTPSELAAAVEAIARLQRETAALAGPLFTPPASPPRR